MRSNCKPLPLSFFERPPELVAPDLLGKLIVRRVQRKERRVRILETEAYLGENDAAAHSAAGVTPRTAVLFGPAGRAYVYFVYGVHWCLNVSTLPAGFAGGVLIRAGRELFSNKRKPPVHLGGPGLLTRALWIDGTMNGCNLTEPGDLFLAEDGYRVEDLMRGPRVGISKATELALRFWISGEAAVSRTE